MPYETLAIEWLKKYGSENPVYRAYGFAKNAHSGMFRANGEPYLNHCLAVARSVKEWNLDENSIAAALLHDVIEDTTFTQKDIEREFGEEIAFLVNGLTKLKQFKYPGKDPYIENMRKLILSFSKDLRVVIIKLADRLHNMQTLDALNVEDQKRIAKETMDIYAPLAYRLGMQRLSGELEDLSFPYLFRLEHDWLLNAVKERYSERQTYAERLKPIIFRALREQQINPIQIDSRAKRYTSLYKKLLRNEMNLEKIHDLVALRIIVQNVEDCYAALGIIHKYWAPLPGKIKDYISRPKPNGYRSLHTTVICLQNKITEIQIRTSEMHSEAELGIAAHWAYQQMKGMPEKLKNWQGLRKKKELIWVEQLRRWQENFKNQEAFLEALKIDFFKDRIFAITPENDVIDLPSGATPVDFAYQIHSEIGNECVGAKVNGKIVPLNYELQSGDLVEIMTQKGKRPSADWLKFIKTSLALKHVNTFLREKKEKLEKKKTLFMEFKILNQDRPGYLKDVTTSFHELKINILAIQGTTDSRSVLANVSVKCEHLDKIRLQKLLVKLKKNPSTKEISYKISR